MKLKIFIKFNKMAFKTKLLKYKLERCYCIVADSMCRYDNLTIYDKVGKFSDETKFFIGSYCGTSIPQTFTIMDSVMMIFTTDFFTSEKGFEIHYYILGKR